MKVSEYRQNPEFLEDEKKLLELNKQLDDTFEAFAKKYPLREGLTWCISLGGTLSITMVNTGESESIT